MINNARSLYFNALSEKHYRNSDILIYISLICENRTDCIYFLHELFQGTNMSLNTGLCTAQSS